LLPYSKVYAAIFLTKDTIPQGILLMELRAMLNVHHYTSNEIEELSNKEAKVFIPIHRKFVFGKK
jgi:hypothetical protein